MANALVSNPAFLEKADQRANECPCGHAGSTPVPGVLIPFFPKERSKVYPKERGFEK